MRDNQGGFSLIEFVIVIAILGILLTIGIFATNGMRARSRDHQRHLNSETIAGRLETYYKVNTTRKNSYPSTDELNSKAPVIIGDNDAMIAPGSTTRSLFRPASSSRWPPSCRRRRIGPGVANQGSVQLNAQVAHRRACHRWSGWRSGACRWRA